MRIVETTTYSKRAKKLLSGVEIKAVRDFLTIDPENGAVIRGSGGARKMRFAAKGKGKSGGVRIIYYYVKEDGTIYLLDIYGKNEKEDLTQKEINLLKKLLTEL